MQKLESERAYKILLEGILSGRMTHGAPLSERKLADELGIGRTPVREALRYLVRDGVVEISPGRGTFVRRISLKEIHDIFEVRCGLESMAAFFAATRGPSSRLSEFGPIFREIIADFDSKDTNVMSKIGEKFHREVIRAADNETLLNITCSLRLQYHIAFKLPRHYDTSWIKQSVNEHQSILESIENHDGALAKKLMYKHLNEGLEIRMHIISNLKGIEQSMLFSVEQEETDQRCFEMIYKRALT